MVIATKAAILNLLSIGAAYGVIVAVFQWGWGASLIGLHTTLPIPAYVPMLVFAIVFGLSMDYEVFLLSRVHEAWVGTGDPHRSVAIGIGSTARVITTAAAIMVTVFASFMLNSRLDRENAGRGHGGRCADRRVDGPDDPGAVGHVAARRPCLVAAPVAGAGRAATAPGRQRRPAGRVRPGEGPRRRGRRCGHPGRARGTASLARPGAGGGLTSAAGLSRGVIVYLNAGTGTAVSEGICPGRAERDSRPALVRRPDCRLAGRTVPADV